MLNMVTLNEIHQYLEIQPSRSKFLRKNKFNFTIGFTLVKNTIQNPMYYDLHFVL